MYEFAVLDPRNTPAAMEANDQVFEGKVSVWGIEVTVPTLARRCVSNLDPQHSWDGGEEMSAIEAALITSHVPPPGATLVTIRPDPDSVGAMAVFSLLAKGENLDPAMERIGMVAAADKFARGGWPGPKTLPTRDNPWSGSEGVATAESSHKLAAIAAAVADFKIPLADRVATMERWLLTGKEPEQYRAQVEKERLDMITALETGQIKHELRLGGRVAVVESAHRAATGVGYSLAPVVIARNPDFQLGGGGEGYVKFTICQFTGGFVDLRAVLTELNEREPGWGGSPTIIGSPQGVSSRLTIDEVVAVMEKYLCH